MMNRLLVAGLAASLPFGTSAAAIMRRATELNQSYDFVIVGGGTAGLTIADRVSAAFPNRSVLVVEQGGFHARPPWFEPPETVWDEIGAWIYTDPIPTLGNRSPREFIVGKTVGGSSAANGQVFDRASRHDYDMWSNYSEATEWDWAGLKPFFQKSVTLIEPTAEEVAKFNYTWDVEAAYGGSTPVNASFPPFQWETTAISRQAWQEIGLPVREECAGGDKAGLCWVPTSQTPYDGSRSHAGIGHYEVISDRANYHLLTYHKVNRVVYSSSNITNEIPVIEIQYLNDTTVYNVTATAEVIISAGVVHSPQILQRSGIGATALLEEAGIDVVLDLPGVGYNFQDHTAAQFAVTANTDLVPNANNLTTNVTDPSAYETYAETQYALRPAQGPYTMGVANTAAFVPLDVITDTYQTLAANIRAQMTSGNASQYLPPGTPDTVIAGYLHQMELIAGAYENTDQPMMEAWTSGVPQYGTLLHPLSRGSILINTTDIYGEPIINFNTVNNPLDLDVLVTFVPFFRKLWATDAFKDLGLVETSPGANVTEKADIEDWLINVALQQSDYHPCCTNQMAPLEKGGVVGSDLRVHGLNKLRIADFSVAPLELGTHTQSTAYAIGEKAADLIISDYSS